MGLTLCPLSNVELKVIQKMEDHPAKNVRENFWLNSESLFWTYECKLFGNSQSIKSH